MKNNSPSKQEHLPLDTEWLHYDPSVCRRYGITSAVLLNFLQLKTKKSKKVRRDQRWWYGTLDELAEKFPFFTKGSIRGSLDRLAEGGLILRDNFNRMAGDRTTWYSAPSSNSKEQQVLKLRYSDAAFFSSAEVAAVYHHLECLAKDGAPLGPRAFTVSVNCSRSGQFLGLSPYSFRKALDHLAEKGLASRDNRTITLWLSPEKAASIRAKRHQPVDQRTFAELWKDVMDHVMSPKLDVEKFVESAILRSQRIFAGRADLRVGLVGLKSPDEWLTRARKRGMLKDRNPITDFAAAILLSDFGFSVPLSDIPVNHGRVRDYLIGRDLKIRSLCEHIAAIKEHYAEFATICGSTVLEDLERYDLTFRAYWTALKAALIAGQKAGVLFLPDGRNYHQLKFPNFIWSDKDVAALEAFVSRNPQYCPAEIYSLMSDAVTLGDTSEGFDEHYHRRRANDLGFLLRHFQKIVCLAGRFELLADYKDWGCGRFYKAGKDSEIGPADDKAAQDDHPTPT